MNLDPINSIVLKHTARAGEAIAARCSPLGAESAKLLIIDHVREAVNEALRSYQPPATVTLPTHEGWWWEWQEATKEWLDPQYVYCRDGKFWEETPSQDYECQPGHWLPVALPPKPEGVVGG